MSNSICVEKIKNDQCNYETLVKAETPEETLKIALERSREDLGKLFEETDVVVYPFTIGR